tara:strand:+ start:330 stop:602 length:273 start_codon:yes stop_codon:yes gene_type:complete
MIIKILNNLYNFSYNIYKKLIYYVFVVYENNYPVKPLKVIRQDASYNNNNYNYYNYNDDELNIILNKKNITNLTRSNSDSNLYNVKKHLM